MKYLGVNIWLNAHSYEQTRHGYTPAGEETIARLRLGPLVIGWEMVPE